MNFQQLRYVRAALHNDLNLTEVANQLFTSQSGVSKQIRDLEAELGIDIFVRRGKRLVGLTKAGGHVAEVVDRLLHEADNLKRLSAQFVAQDKGRLTIAATHNQASYVLPPVLLRFAREFPDVEVEIRQGTPRYVSDMLLRGEADIGLATQALDEVSDLATFTCFDWDHVVIVPDGHPLARLPAPTLADIAGFPLITYSRDFAGGSAVVDAFEAAGLKPDLRLTAMDADVIKTYVRLGMGVGIVAQMAMINGQCDGLKILPQSNRLFPHSSTKVALLKGSLLRNYAYSLVRMLAPHVPQKVLTGARPMPVPAQRLASFAERSDLHFEWGNAPHPVAA